jgi:S-formylglutathione hydrolase FrmB
MDKDVPATLILPESYEESYTHFPVTYLLHGAGGSHQSWLGIGDIEGLSDAYQMIFLCPDGGKTSWYIDSPIDPSYQYETHVARECVDYMDSNYRTRPEAASRAIAGLSMGGHGALYLAIRHQDVFAISVAISAGVDIRPFPNNWDLKKRLGDMTTHPQNWQAHTVINLAKQLKDNDLNIVIDCGRDDFFLKVNRALHQQLLEDGVSHIYEEHAGGHSKEYWKASIERQIPYIATQFKAAQAKHLMTKK